MRIAFVITELYEGGAENALWQLCRQLHQRHEIHICCLHGEDGPVAARVRELGICVDGLGIRTLSDLRKLPALKRWFANIAPDVVHSWLFHANFASRLAMPADVPLICGLRVREPRHSQTLPDRWTRGRVARYACVSDEVRTFACTVLRASQQDCVVIQNGVDFEAFAEARESTPLWPPIQGLTVARIARQKALHRLLEGLAQLPPDVVWRWRFVGAIAEPDYQQALTAQARELGIAERIDWVGAVSKQAVFAEYARANLFALPSAWEGQPNVVLEAMAAGIPVITTHTDGIGSLLEADPQCLQVVSGEPQSWVQAMQQLETAAVRESQVDRALAVAQGRSWADVASQYESLYTELLPCAE